MITTPQQRQLFIKDVEDAIEALYLNMAHIDKQEALDEIMYILYSLRIAAYTYGESTLQKKVEEVLALMLNHQNKHNEKIVNTLYNLVNVMVYPYQKEIMIAAQAKY